ncbi:MAG TPA: hypothetical protein PLV59_01065 [Candidatus Dojkabacteria bacterium]|nr:hypothetical protein [Candidatus Dojkabacteria bacterium]
MSPNNSPTPIVDSVDNVGTNPLVVPHSKPKSYLPAVLLSVILTVLVVGGGIAYTLKSFPDFYSNLGLIASDSNVDEEGDNGSEDNNQGSEGDIKDEVKWVTYENKSLGLKFKLPSNYVISYEEIQEDENNPYSYSLTVSTLVYDLKGKNPAKLYEIVNFTTNQMILYTYDNKPGKIPDWAPVSIVVGGKNYKGEAYAMGEGFYNHVGGASAVRYSIRSDFFAYIVSPFSEETPMCAEIDGKEECFTAESEFRVPSVDLENAKKIIESLEFVK